jgi:hypothetical protein
MNDATAVMCALPAKAVRMLAVEVLLVASCFYLPVD